MLVEAIQTALKLASYVQYERVVMRLLPSRFIYGKRTQLTQNLQQSSDPFVAQQEAETQDAQKPGGCRILAPRILSPDLNGQTDGTDDHTDVVNNEANTSK